MRKSLFLVLLLAIGTSCAREPLGENYSFVRHKGAEMPVWVRGNTDADLFIIYLHGGPGGSSFIDIQNNFFADIEAQHAVVYYDQRASGNSLGKSSKSLLTLEQFVEDLDLVVAYVNDRYSPSQIALMGHSWGGTLGTAYLLHENNQSKIAAWIEVDGGHNMGKGAYEYSRDYVLEAADSFIAAGKDVKDWEGIKSYYEGLESWRNTEVVLDHSVHVTKAEGYFFDQENRAGLVGIRNVLFTETDFMALLAQNKKVVLNMDVWHYDFTNQLDQIEIPTLLLWGISDGILPVELAYEANEAMGLEEDQFHVFTASGHSPHYEETELFNQRVLDFIKKYVQ